MAENRGIGAIAIDPDDGTLYIGTGEARHGLSSTTSGRRTPPNAPQLGLYKSTDGGQSFTLAFSRSGSGDPAKGTDVLRGGVNKIVIDPTAPAGRNDPRPIYVGFFGYGIWRSAPSLEGGDAGFKQVFATLFPADPLGDRTEFDLAALPDGKTRAYVGDGSAGSGEAHPPTSEFWRSDDVDQPAANLVARRRQPRAVDEALELRSQCSGLRLVQLLRGAVLVRRVRRGRSQRSRHRLPRRVHAVRRPAGLRR